MAKIGLSLGSGDDDRGFIGVDVLLQAGPRKAIVDLGQLCGGRYELDIATQPCLVQAVRRGALGNQGADEDVGVKHSVGQYVDGMAHTNGIESFWALMKRGYHGTYHRMSAKHLDRYVQEFAGRHNLRDEDTTVQMSEVARGMGGKRLRYSDLIAPVEQPNTGSDVF